MDRKAAKKLASGVGLVGVLGAGASAAVGQLFAATAFVALALCFAPVVFRETPGEYIERKEEEDEAQAYGF